MQPNHVLELLMVEGLWIGWNVYSIYIVVSYAAALRSNDPEIESTIHPMVHSMDEPTAGLFTNPIITIWTYNPRFCSPAPLGREGSIRGGDLPLLPYLDM